MNITPNTQGITQKSQVKKQHEKYLIILEQNLLSVNTNILLQIHKIDIKRSHSQT